MLAKLYSKKSEKELKTLFNIYVALIIVSFIAPILFSILGYVMNGEVHLSYALPFVVVLIWSVLNVDYLRKNRNQN